MKRRLLLWLSVWSLVGLALTNALASGIAILAPYVGWNMTTRVGSRPSFPYSVVVACNYMGIALYPLSALSIAGYLVLLDRYVAPTQARGFVVSQ